MSVLSPAGLRAEVPTNSTCWILTVRLSKTCLYAAGILRNTVEDFDVSAAVQSHRHVELTIERRGPIDLKARIESTPASCIALPRGERNRLVEVSVIIENA